MKLIKPEVEEIIPYEPFLNKYDNQIYEIGKLDNRILVLINLTKKTIDTDWDLANNSTELLVKELLSTDVDKLYYVYENDPLTQKQKESLHEWNCLLTSRSE